MKGIIFDMDGTLIDSTSVWHDIDREFLEKRGLEPDEEYYKHVANSPLKNCAVYTIKRYSLPMTEDEVVNEWLEMAEYKYINCVPLKPFVREFLDQCRADGIKMTVATSCHNKLCYGVLRHNGILDYFDFIATVDDIGKTKDHPDVYFAAMNAMGLTPEDCVVIEDSPIMIDAVKDAGFTLIGMYDEFGIHGHERLKRECDRFIYSFEELLKK